MATNLLEEGVTKKETLKVPLKKYVDLELRQIVTRDNIKYEIFGIQVDSKGKVDLDVRRVS